MSVKISIGENDAVPMLPNRVSESEPPPNWPQNPPDAHPRPNTTSNTNKNTNQGRSFPENKPIEFTSIPMPYAD